MIEPSPFKVQPMDGDAKPWRGLPPTSARVTHAAALAAGIEIFLSATLEVGAKVGTEIDAPAYTQILMYGIPLPTRYPLTGTPAKLADCWSITFSQRFVIGSEFDPSDPGVPQ